MLYMFYKFSFLGEFKFFIHGVIWFAIISDIPMLYRLSNGGESDYTFKNKYVSINNIFNVFTPLIISYMLFSGGKWTEFMFYGWHTIILMYLYIIAYKNS